MKVAIIGGGPAGLYAAILLKKQRPSADIAVYERVVILPGLVRSNSRIRATRRRKLVLSNIRDPSRKTKEESLDGDDVNGRNIGVSVYIGSR